MLNGVHLLIQYSWGYARLIKSKNKFITRNEWMNTH